MRIGLVVAAILAVAASVAAADVTGFVVTGKGTLTGSVTDDKGKGVAKAPVHVVSKKGDKAYEADKDGRYKVAIDGESLVYTVVANAKIGGETAATEGKDGDETITVHEMVPPAVMAKPKDSEAIMTIPDYTDKAIDKNVWARAWMMLDIDDKGVVAQVKFMNRPGYGLDQAGVDEAFKVKFEPAKDRAGKAMRSVILWTWEWPSYFWLKETGSLGKLPISTGFVDCQKPGETKDEKRNCTPPDLSKSFDEKWIARPAKKK